MQYGKVLINGHWIEPTDAGTIEVVSPSTEEVIGRVPDVTPATVDAAVVAARNSFDEGAWRFMDVGERADILEDALRILDARSDEIGRVVTSEMGLPARVAELQIPGALATARFFLSVARDEPVREVRRLRTVAAILKEPVGVIASIAPWNGPFGSILTKSIPALVTGCSTVYKPAPETPLDGYFFAAALLEAGVPEGVFNFITGGVGTGRALVAHPDVDKVSFTGSTAAGRQIGEVCGRDFKRVQLELGGKSAAIVAEDADLDTTIESLARGAFANSGQICSSLSRILLPASRYDEFADALVAKARSITVGDPTDPDTVMGPLVSERQRNQVERYIASGVDEGAQVLTGGKRPKDMSKGWFVEPTVFGSAANSMKICQEEIFGPVTSLISYRDLPEAISIANDSEYGLHGAVFTTDDDKAVSVARAVRSGTFSVNCFVYNTEAPFGGVKNSGLGRDTGREGLNSFYELKTVNLAPSVESLFDA